MIEYTRLNFDPQGIWVVSDNRIVLKSIAADYFKHLCHFHYRGMIIKTLF
jgi:hypothetical protein